MRPTATTLATVLAVAATTAATGAPAVGTVAEGTWAHHLSTSPNTNLKANPNTTLLRIEAPSCEGCVITPVWSVAGSHVGTFEYDPVTVTNGVAQVEVPWGNSRGLQLQLKAPWEGRTGYATFVVIRYSGTRTGEAVSFATARSKTRATRCWGGVAKGGTTTTVKLGVRKVWVDGVGGRAKGTIAWAKSTPQWLKPMESTARGVLGAQDLAACVA